METQQIESYFRDHKHMYTPWIHVENCVCGALPSRYSSSGWFNYYDYYKCSKCNIFVTWRHEFPSIWIAGFWANENNEPKLFVRYDGEFRAEKWWNEFIKNKTAIIAK